VEDQVTQSTGGSVAVSRSSLTLKHLVVQGSGSPAFRFVLDEEETAIGHNESALFSWLTPGRYSLAIELGPDWIVEAVTCTDDVSFNLSSNTLQPDSALVEIGTINLARGVDATCTISTRQDVYGILIPLISR
jgi:hypothetical protein